jgi:hypothetical protein
MDPDATCRTPRQPPGCRGLALGLPWAGFGAAEGVPVEWDVGCEEGVWTGSGSTVRVVADIRSGGKKTPKKSLVSSPRPVDHPSGSQRPLLQRKQGRF